MKDVVAENPSPVTPDFAEETATPLLAAARAGGTEIHCEPFEYLVDLRSKLIMVEIPEELENEIPDLRLVIDSFSEQLQFLGDIRDALHQLYTSGNFRFQGKYEVRHQFQAHGSRSLQDSLSNLQEEIIQWNLTQKLARDQYYFLNYFTMREMLQMIVLLDSGGMAQIHRFGDHQAFRDAMIENMSLVQETHEKNDKKKGKPKKRTLPPTPGRGGDTNTSAPPSLKDIAPGKIANVQDVCGTDEDTARAFLGRYDSVERAIATFMDTGGVLPPMPAEAEGLSSPEHTSEEANQVAHIQAVCATDAETASAFLKHYDGNTEAAISNFMDNNGVLPDAPKSSPAPPKSGASTRRVAQAYTLDKQFKVALEFSSMLHLVILVFTFLPLFDINLIWFVLNILHSTYWYLCAPLFNNFRLFFTYFNP